MDASTDSASAHDRERAIGEFVARALGLTPTHVARMRAFATNEVYEVDAGDRRFIVKASAHDASRAEAWACIQGAMAGCAAPPILGVGALDGRTGAFVMPRVDGAPIDRGHPALREVGARLRALHRVTLPRFGALAEVGWSERDAFTLRDATWLGYVRRICADTRRIGTDAAIAVAGAAAAAIDAHADALATVGAASLCHGDLKAAHLLVDGPRLAAVIDWGDAAAADPLWDIARFGHRADAESLALLLDGYDPAGALRDDLAWRLPLYSALWLLVDAIVDARLGERTDAPIDAALGYLRRLG